MKSNFFIRLFCLKDKAKVLAEAIANKDCYKHYYELVDNNDGSISWQKTNNTTRSIYQTLLHDADCLDIHRAREIILTRDI